MKQISLNTATIKQIIGAEKKTGVSSIRVNRMQDEDTFAFWPTKEACKTLTSIDSTSLYMCDKVLAWCTQLTSLKLYEVQTKELELVLSPPTLQKIHLMFLNYEVYVIRLTRDMKSFSLRDDHLPMLDRAFDVDACEQPQIRVDFFVSRNDEGLEIPRVIDTRKKYVVTLEVEGDLVTLIFNRTSSFASSFPSFFAASLPVKQNK